MNPTDQQVYADIAAASERIATAFARHIVGRSTLLMMEPDEVEELLNERVADLYHNIIAGGASENDARIGAEQIRALTIRKCAAMARTMLYEGGNA